MGHFAVGWDGLNIITYYDGVPVGKQAFTGPRISTGTYNGSTMLLMGGSTHQNMIGRIAQVRGFEENNPRASAPETTFTPPTLFSRRRPVIELLPASRRVRRRLVGWLSRNSAQWSAARHAAILFQWMRRLSHASVCDRSDRS
jgi:hypothetical protein